MDSTRKATLSDGLHWLSPQSSAPERRGATLQWSSMDGARERSDGGRYDHNSNPPSIPTECEFFAHLMKPIPGESLGWHDLIPAVVRNSAERHATAILCAGSNVVASFLPSKLSVAADRVHLILEISRFGTGGPSAQQFINIATITDVGRMLPRSFGVEAVGNPLSGSRLTIKCSNDRAIVLYALTQGQQMRWFDYLSWRIETQRMRGDKTATDRAEAAARDALPPANRTPVVHIVDVPPPPIRARPPPLSDVYPGHDGNSMEDGDGTAAWSLGSSLSGGARMLKSSLREPADSLLHDTVPFELGVRDSVGAAHHLSSQRQASPVVSDAVSRGDVITDFLTDFVSAPETTAAMKPLRFEEQQPDRNHLLWRFGELLNHVECGADFADTLHTHSHVSLRELETMRKLRNLDRPGVWSELGQAPARLHDAGEETDSSFAAQSSTHRTGSGDQAALATPPPSIVASGRYSQLRRDGRIKTAADHFHRGDLNEAASSIARSIAGEAGDAGGEGSSAKEAAVVAEMCGSIWPWVAFDPEVNAEQQMDVIWRLAHLRIEVQDSQSMHEPLPAHLRVADVQEFWKEQYDTVASSIRASRAALRTRLGLSLAVKAANTERRRADISKLLPASLHDQRDPLGLAQMPSAPPRDDKNANAVAAPNAKKKEEGVRKQVTSFVRFLM